MGYLGKQPSAVPLTSDDITDNTITSAKIVDGTIVNADINDVAATKLSGTIADARVSASSVNQHVDLTELEQDVMILGLHTATARNSSETDLSSSHIIRFEDDTQIATETTGDRNATNECWSSVTETETAIPVKLLVTNGTNASSTVTATSDSPMTVNTYGSPTWTTAAYI